MLQLTVRTFLIYIFIFFAVKLMGKHELAELHPFDLVVLLLISDMACVSIQDTAMPLLQSAVPIVTLTLLDVGISLIALHSPRFRRFAGGTPSVLIERGKVREDELRRQRMTLDDLAQELRAQGYFALHDVEYAVMESNGEVNAIPRSELRPLTPSDMQIETEQEEPAFILIADGRLSENALKAAGKSKSWLQKELHRQHIEDIAQIFLAEWSEGRLYIQIRQKEKRK